MKAKFFAIAAIAATTLFASCSKDNGSETTNNGTDIKVTMKIGGMQTRALNAEAIGAKAAILNDGYIVFTTAAGQITKVVEFGAAKPITPAMLAAGKQITQVPGVSANVTLFGNIPASLTVPTAGNISAIKALLADVTSQKDATEGVDRVTLYGGDAIGGTAPNYTSTFDIKPIAARIEIAGIAPKAGSVLTSFKVDGIFINNYFLNERLDGAKNTAAGNGLVNNGAGGNTTYGAVAPYNVAGFPMSDYDLTSGLTQPTAPAVWAYNVFAPSNQTAVTDHTHVIIRVSSIVTSDGSTFSDPQYVTIKRFKNTSTTALLDYLAAGHVYGLGTIYIAPENLSPEAEDEYKSVTVEADVVNWIPVAVEPEM